MNYIPVVAWGLCPGGTTKQIASHFSSWGLLGEAPEPVTIIQKGWSILCGLATSILGG